jgi:hypothetical protein
MLIAIVLLAANLMPGAVISSQVSLFDTPTIPGQKWRVHDRARPQPKVVKPGDADKPGAPPSDAIVLFNVDNLNQFSNKDLLIVDGAMIMGPGGQETNEAFGDIQLNMDWSSPIPPLGGGQDRGKIGIQLMGLYEVQVLDSFQNPTYADGVAGAVYGQQPPMVIATTEPGHWQTYDIFFRAPRFNQDHSLRLPAYVTVIHNGVLVQFHQAFLGPTRWRRNTSYQYHAQKLPLSLQWHGSPVRYRNIWVRPLEEYNAPDPESHIR